MGVIRRNILPFIKSFAIETQFGSGFNGGDTAFAHLYIRFFIDAVRCNKTSGAVLFLDIIPAFAVLLRRIIFDTDSGDEARISKLCKCGFSDGDVLEI